MRTLKSRLRNLMAFLMTLLSLTLVMSFGSAVAGASSVLKQEFGSTYYTHYRAGRCGENTADLAKRGLAVGVDLSGAYAVVITNGGYMLSTTYRRGAGEKLATPVHDIKFSPGIANFYFHVALLKDGEIYDFDFGNHPEVMPIKDYIRRMFWEEHPKSQFKMLDRLNLRQDYKIAFVPMGTYLREMNATGFTQYDLSDYYDSL
jgi:hypothetical protein